MLHVYGADEASTFYGWAQTHSQGFFQRRESVFWRTVKLWNSVDIVTAEGDWSSVSDILKGR